MNIEQLLKDRFRARLALAKVGSEQERQLLLEQIAKLTAEINRLRPR